MKLQKSNTNKKRLIYGLLVAGLLSMVATGALAYKYQWGPFDNQPTAEEIKNTQNNSDSTNDQQKDAKSQVENPNVDTSKTTNEIPVSTTVSLSITRLAQENGAVTLVSTLENPGENGTCSVQFVSEVAKPVSRTVDAINGTCQEVTIPEQEFSAIGTWKATLRYYTADTQAVDTKTIEIK